MSKVKVFNQQGKEVGEQDLNPSIFSVEVKPAVVQQAVVALTANARQVLASTKDKSEVRGGGKKPWKQKGTGRARHGSIRSPLWRGGGITFGPTTERNFSLKINKKVKKKALFMCLTDKVVNQKLVLLDNLDLAEVKTKKFFEILQNLQLRDKKEKKEAGKSKEKSDKKKSKKVKSVLVVTPQKEDKVIKSARNIDRVKIVSASSLNILDVLKHQCVLMPVGALNKIEETFLKK